ncbi:hypothetical protein E2562_010156 [Oryza meyeriana var. granulata]|uniref:Uncharacterized protein n=1 Tax=Oryza meyeriana var. granulata TaxID=110450 RepID=A0A6G1EID5_9ORYZ|nr:hypothetical protein E2562_010156 [Oryza meyeriana var. granulata]
MAGASGGPRQRTARAGGQQPEAGSPLGGAVADPQARAETFDQWSGGSRARREVVIVAGDEAEVQSKAPEAWGQGDNGWFSDVLNGPVGRPETKLAS